MQVDVCVVGAGPVGATLACRLAGQGVRVALIDRAALPPMEHPDFDGRAYAIAAGSRAVLEAAGVWDRLPYPAGPIRDIRVSDGRIGRPASPLFLHFDHREVTTPEGKTRPFGWMVEARSLRMAVNRLLPDLPGLTLFAPADAAVTFDGPAAQVRIAGGPAIACGLVVAADGRGSALRRQAGVPVTTLPYHQTGIVCAIAHARPHHGTALEHFLPAGPFAQLPMAATDQAPDVSALVWTEATPMAARLMALDDATFTREAARRLGGHLGVIRLIGRRWSYPLSALHAHRYVAPRLALVGDAAHGIHPIAGQGLNLGFRDVDALAGLVVAAVRSGGDPGDAGLLAAYQRRRRPDNMAMLLATDALDRLFSSDSTPLRLLRDVGMSAFNRLPRLKRAVMRQAMGLPQTG
jgi:2-octaprenyl-6-methoxyphenol hydroxylase